MALLLLSISTVELQWTDPEAGWYDGSMKPSTPRDILQERLRLALR